MKTNLCKFIRNKIAEVEKSITSREQVQKTFLGGTEESWKKAADMHPSTAGKPIKKSERLEEAAYQGRNLTKLRQELEMFKEILETLLVVRG